MFPFNMLSAITSLISRTWAGMHFFLHFWWISLNNWAAGTTRVPAPSTPNGINPYIAFIGDDMVAGIGDWVTVGGTPGLTEKLEYALRKVSTVRRHWRIVRYGVTQSVTADWSPKSTTSHKKSKNIFEHCFGKESGVFYHAPVVCICVGSNDTVDPDITKQHVVEISLALTAMGKHVFVSGLPPPRKKTEIRSS
eukprot:PhF_6_TR7646/c0_g2_i1/m.11179